jgi:hypothetical protein
VRLSQRYCSQYHQPLEDIKQGVSQYEALGVPKKDLVMIWAWFGMDVACTNSSGGCALQYPHCYAKGTGDGHDCQPGYSTIMHELLPHSIAGVQWDEAMCVQLPTPCGTTDEYVCHTFY